MDIPIEKGLKRWDADILGKNQILGWNQRKVVVLRAIKNSPNSTPKDIALKLSMSTESAEMELVRLTRQGLLNRVAGAGSYRKPIFQYLISERGDKRLSFLEAREV